MEGDPLGMVDIPGPFIAVVLFGAGRDACTLVTASATFDINPISDSPI